MTRAAAVLAGVLVAACGGSPARTAPADSVGGTISVFAAASLTAAFNDEGRAFQAEHPTAPVQFNFAGSAALAAQILQGAPADVFASADLPNMQRVVDAGAAAGSPRTFASNRLQIVVAPGNPKGVKGLADLAKPGLVVVLCAPQVPCGSYAGQALARAGVKVTARSQEQDVNAVVSKIALGEADAGIVYVTDVRAAGARVQGVDIADEQNVVATYPVASLKAGPNSSGARAFIDFLLSDRGQGILAGYGFEKPR